MKFAINIQNDIAYRIMKFFFETMFHFLIMLQNTLIGCALVTMATNLKIRFHNFNNNENNTAPLCDSRSSHI